MWRSYEEDAIYIGLDLNYFWSLNVKQYGKHIKAFNKKEQDKAKQIDGLNYLLGQYISVGFNDPKNYPDKPFMSKDKNTELEPMTNEQMEKMARRNTIKMGGVINDSR